MYKMYKVSSVVFFLQQNQADFLTVSSLNATLAGC